MTFSESWVSADHNDTLSFTIRSIFTKLHGLEYIGKKMRGSPRAFSFRCTHLPITLLILIVQQKLKYHCDQQTLYFQKMVLYSIFGHKLTEKSQITEEGQIKMQKRHHTFFQQAFLNPCSFLNNDLTITNKIWF